MHINGKRDALRLALIVLIAITVLSFFIHSLMPRDVSAAESSGVAELIGRIFPEDTPLGAFLIGNVRKIAHFCEYGLFGTELALYVIFFAADKKRSALLSLGAAHAVAFVDESLQIISKRGPSIADVWLDMLGFVTLFALVLLSAFIINKIRTKDKNG